MKIEITRPIWSGRGQFYYQNLIWYDDYYGPGVKERKHLFYPLPNEVYERYGELRQKYLGEVKLDQLLNSLNIAEIGEILNSLAHEDALKIFVFFFATSDSCAQP